MVTLSYYPCPSLVLLNSRMQPAIGKRKELIGQNDEDIRFAHGFFEKSLAQLMLWD